MRFEKAMISGTPGVLRRYVRSGEGDIAEVEQTGGGAITLLSADRRGARPHGENRSQPAHGVGLIARRP
jgi:hypothetical protein